MDNLNSNKSKPISIILVLLLIFGFVSTIFSFWSALGKSILGVGAQLAVNFSLPTVYYVLSCLFALLLLVTVVLAYRLKSVLLILMPLLYQLITVFAVICLAILATNANNNVYILYLITFSLFAPLYGFCELTYVWSLFLILPLFFATIIVAFKVIRFNNQKKCKTNKRK